MRAIRFFSLLLTVCLLFAGVSSKAIAVYHGISSHSILETIRYLASEELKGRLTGSQGYKKAAEFIAEQLRCAGIDPLFEGSYFQSFSVSYTEILTPGEVSLVLPVGKGGILKKRYMIYRDYIPAGYSGAGEVKGEAVFVGYGITAPEFDYDDYTAVDVKGKVVILLRGAPENKYQKWKKYWSHQYKLRHAYEKGAVGVLYYMGAIASPNGLHIEGFPVVNVAKSVVEDLFAGTGHKVDKVIARIRKTLRPASFYTGKEVYIKVESRHYPEAPAFNVGGILRGKSSEYIIFGAHLDHCGSVPDTIYGADDNASGSAVVLELARAFSRLKEKLNSNLVFLFFAGEEMGLLGSKYFVEHPPFPLNKIKAMFNFDMVGIGERIFIGGGKNFPEIFKVLEEVNRNYIHRELRTGRLGRGRPGSDHAPFFEKGVKAFFVATGGGHPVYYHRREDTPDTITPEIAEDVARLFFLAGYRLAKMQ